MSGKGYDYGGYPSPSLVSVHSTSSSIMEDLMEMAKKIKSVLNIEDVATSCRCCHGAVRRSHDFCSQDCVFRYWENTRQRTGKSSGNSVGE